MEKNLSKSNWFSHILKIAIPVSLQSLLASSLSVIDQIMVGSLGETDIASVSLAGRFPTVFFSVGSITVAASILISQFRGKADKEQISRAFLLMFRWGLLLTALFFAVSYFFAAPLMTLFSPDLAVQTTGSDYLRIVTLGFLPGFASGMFSTYLRTTGRPGLPTIASVFAMVSNTILNYILIFGHLGFSAMGVHGAAIATTIARLLEFGLVLFFFLIHMRNSEWTVQWKVTIHGAFRKMAIIMALPIFLSELAWSMGEAIYGIVYGHIGTDETAAMS
ncbi:MAG: MATE family efflux transporter, partial [Candidatus Izemoplasmatales bacterium]|nr:MATE family efflux transporter [Candidatus Izemoplasmatales bacterium]